MTSPSLYGKGPANPNVMFSKGSIIPSSNEHFNLGSPAARWKELYLSGNTIHLGDTYLSSDADGVFVDALYTSNVYTDRVLTSDEVDSQISPSFSWKNDSNSGMFHADADQIGFTTGGVERLRISAYGSIGIGTTNPQAPLHVDGTIKATAFIGDGTLLSGIGGSSKWTYTNDGIDIYVAGKSVGIGTNLPDEALDVRGTVKAEAFVGDGSQLVGIVASKWTNTGSDLFVTGSNVGIGTTAPQETLDVVGAVKATSFVGDGTLLTGIVASKWLNTGTDLFVTGSNVGIGTEAPQQTLDVNGTIKANLFIGNGSQLVGIDASKWSNIGSNMYVTGSNIGINTTNPSHALHVVGDTRIQGNLTVNGIQTIVNTEVGTTEQLVITNDGTGPALVINQLGDQPILEVQDGGTPVLVIVDGGNVGIGTMLPQSKLHVLGTARATTFSGSGEFITDLSTSSLIGAVTVANGGTNLSSTPTNGQILIGNGSGYSLGTITQGTGITVTNGEGTITIASIASTPSSGSGYIEFTTPTTTTWAIPSTANVFQIEMWSGGGGGGSGAKNQTTTTAVGGGGGGAAGGCLITTLYKSMLGSATQFSIIVGAGGAGGIAPISVGLPGVAGGTTTFSYNNGGTIRLITYGGNAGVGGSATSAAGGTTNTTYYRNNYYTIRSAGSAGGASGSAGAVGEIGVSQSLPKQATGGGGGGGVTTANAQTAGGTGGTVGDLSQTESSAAAGAAGSSYAKTGGQGGGGGGGSGSNAGSGSVGGAGGVGGGGGGGGGGGRTGGGVGGKGGDGFLRIVYF